MAWIAIGSSVASGVGAFLGGNGGQKDPSIQTKTIDDPLKKEVASAYAPYLASQVGQGVGNMPVDPLYQARYNDLMGMDANSYFDKNIYQPQLKYFKDLQQPLIDESWAGGLRGSGHATQQLEGINSFENNIGQQRASEVNAINSAQQGAGQAYQKQAYDQWYNSLPQNNPALKSGLDFLNNSTNTGQTILSGLDPGQNGWMGILLSSLAGLGGSVYSSNQIAGALKGSNQPSNSDALAAWFNNNQNSSPDLTNPFTKEAV